MRKPVGVAAITEPGASVNIRQQTVWVVCDDGAVFISRGGPWRAANPIPGSQREAETASKGE